MSSDTKSDWISPFRTNFDGRGLSSMEANITDDIVEGFDEILNLEETFVKIGYDQGVSCARQALIDSARNHGQALAKRVGFEAGYYSGFAHSVTDLGNRQIIELSPRTERALQQLQLSIEQTRQAAITLDKDHSLSSRILLMRTRFNILLKSLQLQDRLRIVSPAAKSETF